MKYIIKNCPNLTTSFYSTGEIVHNQCGCSDDDMCKDMNNCLLKQIVSLCKMEVGSKDNMFLISRYALADDILNLLEIEECER